jgi:dGTP triphosphohydrolase
MLDTYESVVQHLEGSLGNYAMKSFDSKTFVDGGEFFAYYTDIWKKDTENFKLNNRTPIQHQRDRILYSNGVRKQSERYHILYRGGQRIIRNYITHTMRMMQVARTICRALKLNEDFAEAIVLGSKVGALPFIHASKDKVSNWIKEKIKIYDQHEEQYASKTQKSVGIDFDDPEYLPKHPDWIRRIKNNKVKTLVEEYIPFATGLDINEAYSSGKQGYWLLTTNPYTHESQTSSFTPELMYGIWRHSLNAPFGKDSFFHKQKITKASNEYHKIEWSNVSYESLVVQYADDITWVIENLNDSNNATLLNNPQNKGLFQELFDQGNFESKILIQGLSKRDSGKLYSYFINDFITHSQSILSKKDGLESKILLKEGDKNYIIGLSVEGQSVLKNFKDFLNKKVFSENRVSHRKKMLETITEGCMDLIYNGKDEYLHRYIDIKGNIDGWTDEQKKLALNLLDNDIHRIQVTVNVFSELSDQEIFSFVGMDSF